MFERKLEEEILWNRGSGVIEVIGVREGVPLMRHDFFMGDLHRQPGQL